MVTQENILIFLKDVDHFSSIDMTWISEDFSYFINRDVTKDFLRPHNLMILTIKSEKCLFKLEIENCCNVPNSIQK